MPRKKLIRRCEPQFGVSRKMLEIESEYVRRELQDYLLQSRTDLSQRLDLLKQKHANANEVLSTVLEAQPEQERLVLNCLITRDIYHLIELYCTVLGAYEKTPPELVQKKDDSFNEWLFDPK